MELENQIIKLQEEYQKIILEIKKLQKQSKIKKANLEEKESEFDRENNRLFNINEDIEYNIQTNQKHKEKYIKNSLEELEKILVGLFCLLFTIIGVITCLIFAKNINILLKIGIITMFPLVGGTMSLYISDKLKNKYKPKLERKYLESIQNKEYQSQLTEFRERKETIEKEHQIKYQIYKSAKDEYDNIINQIKIKKEELHQIREKLISLVFPNDLFVEVQNLTNETLFEDNKLDLTELKIQSKTKKKTKPE